MALRRGLHLPTQQNLSSRLDQLPRRASGECRLVARAGRAEHSMLLRLLEIGFLPGETVQVVARGGWGGDPIAVRVGQATFALRRQEASMVQVQPLDDTSLPARLA